MKIDLSGKHVLVTGGSRGIGKGIVQAIADAGAKVAIHYNRNALPAKELAAEAGNGSKAFKADLEDPLGCENLFKEVLGDFGHLDVLVNNAGIAINSALSGSDSLWIRDWDRTMAVNLRATGLLCKLAVRHFAERGGGRIVNIASRAAFRGDTAEYLAYAASKGGVVALSKSLARAFGKQGIKCFVVAPGFVRTDMAQDFIDEYGEGFALNDIALDKLTEPKDVGPFVAFLSSGLADHATGTTIDINAGSYVH